MSPPGQDLPPSLARLEGRVIRLETELIYLKPSIESQFRTQREYMDQKFAALANGSGTNRPGDLLQTRQWIGMGIGILISNAIIIFALWASGAFG